MFKDFPFIYYTLNNQNVNLDFENLFSDLVQLLNKAGTVIRILPSGRTCRFAHEPHLSILTFLHFLSFTMPYSDLNYPVEAFEKEISYIEKCNLFLINIHYSALSFYISITYW